MADNDCKLYLEAHSWHRNCQLVVTSKQADDSRYSSNGKIRFAIAHDQECKGIQQSITMLTMFALHGELVPPGTWGCNPGLDFGAATHKTTCLNVNSLYVCITLC